MNNGKVRLYDLSRELNVDNKQVLAFCDQLDIAYKSHSSTITEADAARIRQEAENAPAVSEPARPSGSGPNTHRTKQKILKIEHRSPNAKPAVQGSDPETTGDNRANSDATSSNLDSPELVDKPVRPKSPSPAKPQPANTPPVEATNPKKPVSSQAPSRDDSDSAPVNPASEAKTIEADSKAEPEQKQEEVPQLIGPPPRPQPRAKKHKGRDKPTVERPTIAKDKPSSAPRPSAPSKDKEADSPRPVSSSPQKPSRPAERDEQEPVSAGPPSRPESKRPVPKLKRPPELVRLNAKTEEVEPEAPENEPLAVEPEDDTDETEQLTLKRPKLPRKAKTKKRRTTEEDPVESLEAANKANKPKRRVRPIDDDDEDFEADLNTDSNDAMEVSLSIARPPKATKSKSESRPSTQQRRKPAPQQRGSGDSSGGSSSSSRNRRDRRERANKVERPELVEIRDNLTVRELADLLLVPETEIVKRLFMQGIAVNVTQTLDVPTATMVAEELDVLVETPEKEQEARKVTDMIDATDLDSLQRRPPVVTIMGHVDHGKTTLLDSIRKTKVAQGEAGGITQHTGAYHVDVEHEGVMHQIVFLDTPGHEAFTAMRARGARVTDIAILVVAADDGVQPQTIEAISHARAAGVPLVVAVNKMDKEQANPDRVKQELMEHGLVPEEWGGDTVMVPVSAITGDNLDTLLEMIILVSEVEELSANPDRPARGTVIEAHLDKARGSVATLLVQNGTLRVGDTLVAGSVFAKVRAMIDDRGNRVDEAKPSFAVEVLGMNDVPEAGDEFEVFTNEKEARSEADRRKDDFRQSRLQQTMASRRVTLSSLSARASEGELKELNLVLKADVQGSLEAILGSLEQLPQDEVQLRVLYAAPGEIAETDIDLAAASDAVILGFNTTLASGARQAAEREGVDVRDYSVIYNLLDDIQGAMEGLLDPEMVEEELGQAQVRAIFPSGRGQVAGCYVLSGQLVRNAKVRILRNDKVVHENVLDSLRRMREDVRDVKSGYECGLGIDRFSDWQEGDIVYCYRMASKRRTLASR